MKFLLEPLLDNGKLSLTRIMLLYFFGNLMFIMNRAIAKSEADIGPNILMLIIWGVGLCLTGKVSSAVIENMKKKLGSKK